MFTASIQKNSFSEGVMQVVVDFSDGTDTVTRAFNISSERDLKRQVKNELDRLNDLSNLAKTLTEGVYDASDTVAPPPTQAEIDKHAWFRNFNRLEQLAKLESLGALRPALAEELVTLRETVATDFRKAYIADM